MKKLLGLVAAAMFVSGSAFADNWAFDGVEKITEEAPQPMMVVMQEAQPSWTFCEADATYTMVDYDSHTFN